MSTNTTLYRTVSGFSLGIILTFLGLYAVTSYAQSSCPVSTSQPYKSPNYSAVWYVSDDCTKRAVKDPNVYFSHFGTWNDVSVISDAVLGSIPNNVLGFLPWGTRRNFSNGSVLKTVNDPKVYLVISGTKYPIGSESAFTNLGYEFNQVEDVVQDVLSPLPTGEQIDDIFDYPAGLVFGYEGDNTLYVMERDANTNRFARRHIESFTDVERDYRTDRLAQLPAETVVKSSSRGAVSAGTSLTSVGNVSSVVFSDEVVPSTNSPASPVCGNGIVETTESCDAGSDNGRPGYCNISCNGTVTLVVNTENSIPDVIDTPTCGNGLRESTETCDDGSQNGSAGYCNAQCNGSIAAPIVCGNGIRESGEICDDGTSNGIAGSCNTSCNGTVPTTVVVGPTCGDGVMDAGEFCDSGQWNGVPENCNSTCTGMTGSEVTTPATRICGNGALETGEICDDGNNNGYPGMCDDTCNSYVPNETEQTPSVPNTPVCGNGTQESGETCDDGSNNGNVGSCNLSCSGTVPAANQTPYTPAPINLAGRDTPNSCDVSGFGLNGPTYYFCECASGSDSDCQAGSTSGLSTDPANPSNSLSGNSYLLGEHWTGPALPAGGSVALCRGGAFDVGELTMFNQNCTASNRCQLTDYTPTWASGNEERPVIRSTGTGLAFSNLGDSVRDGGYVVTNINLKHVGGDPNTFGVFVFNEADDIYACNIVTDGYGVGLATGGGSNPVKVTGDGVSERFTLEYSEIINNTNQGWLGACDDCFVDNNFFDNNGYLAPGGGAFSHAIYLGGGATNMTVLNNEIYRTANVNGGACEGTIVVAHGYLTDVRVENNTIIEDPNNPAAPGCWGIAFTPAYGGDYFRNITIRNNLVQNVGNTPITAPGCENCTIESNTTN